MAVVNWSSILSKAEACMKTPAKKKERQDIVDKKIVGGLNTGSGGSGINNVTAAANRFVEILKECIDECAGSDFSNGDLGETAIDALKNITIGTAGEYGSRNCYSIPITFSMDDRHRDSLAPDVFSGVGDIVVLLNNGYPRDGHEMGVVFGKWHGKQIQNLRDRQGAHFIESAVHKFMTSEARKYGVTDIKVNVANYKEYY